MQKNHQRSISRAAFDVVRRDDEGLLKVREISGGRWKSVVIESLRLNSEVLELERVPVRLLLRH